jgi:O-antigen/teichoic acid export membrane protein
VPVPRQTRMARRLFGFSGLSLVSAIGPLAVLPVIARLSDAPDWAALGVGQSVGAFLALVVLFGWNLAGPTRVARATPAEQSSLYRESICARMVLLVAVLPVGAVLATVLAPQGSALLAVLMAASMMINGLSPAWFCVGAGRPGWIARYDAGPRLLGTLVSMLVVAAGGPLVLYPVVMAVATGAGVYAFTLKHRPDSGARWPALPQLARSLAGGGVPAATMVIAGAYSSAPVAIAAAVLPVGSLAVFVSAERLYRFGLSSISTLSNSVQGWVAEVGGAQGRRRAAIALSAHAVLGLAGATAIILLGPWASRILFGDQLAVGRAVFVGFGLAFLASSLSTSLGRHVLVPRSRTGLLLWSTAVGAVVGVASMLICGRLYGASGASAAFALSESAVAAVQMVAAVLVVREERRLRPAPSVAPGFT